MAQAQKYLKVYLSPEQDAELRAFAAREERTVAGIVRLAVAEWLAKQAKQAAA